MPMSRNKIVGLIPSRLESSRLPKKALADICGLPMVVHVFHRCLMAKKLDEVFIATDSKEIAAAAEKYHCRVIMTRSDHETGTDRLAEAARKIDCDIVVNIQGDEALVKPEHIDVAIEDLDKSPDVNMV